MKFVVLALSVEATIRQSTKLWRGRQYIKPVVQFFCFVSVRECKPYYSCRSEWTACCQTYAYTQYIKKIEFVLWDSKIYIPWRPVFFLCWNIKNLCCCCSYTFFHIRLDTICIIKSRTPIHRMLYDQCIEMKMCGCGVYSRIQLINEYVVIITIHVVWTIVIWLDCPRQVA